MRVSGLLSGAFALHVLLTVRCMPLHGGRGLMKHKEPPVSLLMPVLLFRTFDVVSCQLLKIGNLLFSYFTFDRYNLPQSFKV